MFRTVMISAAALVLFSLILLALRVPMPPMLIAPPDGSIVNPALPIEFKWRYGGILYRSPIVWRRADYFVVCVQEFTTLEDMKCEYPANAGSEPPWAAPRSDFESVSAAADSRWAESIRIYSHTVDALPPGLQGKHLMWTVAACASTSPSSCNQAIPAWQFRHGQPNLVGDFVNNGLLSGNNVPLVSAFHNAGNAPTGAFDLQIRVAQMQMNGSQPNRDVNAASATAEVLLTSGRIVQVSTLGSAGSRSNSGVMGLLVAGGFRQDLPGTHPGLAPNASGTWNPTLTLPSLGMGIGIVLMLDPNDQIHESDETDNTKHDRGLF